MDPRKSLESPDLYTVGWIAALYLERAAATAFLDEEHAAPQNFVQPSTDSNAYSWGSIAGHNVVIASLESGIYGTTSAATTAMAMLSSFPSIRFGLLVGIGAAAKSEHDGQQIRLGDIAVSLPDGDRGGVIQYDLQRVKSGQQRESKSFLNKPPTVLLKALGSLQAKHELQSSMVAELLKKTLERHPKMAKAKYGYIHQGFENDRLFLATYNHIGGADCSNCDPKKEVQRQPRESREPEIHYGTIASGNILIQDAVTRDELVAEMNEECICFEMEAAGLMNSFPCLVIRGISDYADSHKNYRWQRYATATAAAYAKELLGYIQTNDLQKAQKVVNIRMSPSPHSEGRDK